MHFKPGMSKTEFLIVTPKPTTLIPHVSDPVPTLSVAWAEAPCHGESFSFHPPHVVCLQFLSASLPNTARM